MEAAKKRNIQSGDGYTHLFPKAEGGNKTIRKNADVTHTVAFIPKVVNETLHHTRHIAQRLKGTNTYESCSNIWHFVYQHIAYRKDQEGYEQIRSPARAWHDRHKGVDCDCYTVFISSILTNLNIPHILRITKYHRDYFQHIYPVAVLNGKEIPIDCVTDKFDYEVPYSQNKDYPMDLQYLNGFDGDDLGQLFGKKKAKGAAKANAKPKKPSVIQKLKSKVVQKAKTKPAVAGDKPKKKGLIKKVLNKVNKINPATVLLRNGVLAAMKLNVKNVAGRLRWSYLTPEQAAAKGIDLAKFQRLIATRQKLEKIFFGAGGNEKNLKKAILDGKGNKDKAVAGLGGFNGMTGIDYMNAYTPLPQLLGPEIYTSENLDGMHGFAGLGQLGEPVTLASVGAAMGVISGIVVALKQIGDIFKNKSEGSKDFDPQVNEAAENNQPIPGTTPIPEAAANNAAKEAMSNAQATMPSNDSNLLPSSSSSSNTSEPISYEPSADTVIPSDETGDAVFSNDIVPQTGAVTPSTGTTTGTNNIPVPTKETFWEKNWSWLKPVAIGAGGIGLIAIGMAVLKPKKSHSTPQRNQSLSGVPKRRKKNHKRKTKQKANPRSKYGKKKAVALL